MWELGGREDSLVFCSELVSFLITVTKYKEERLIVAHSFRDFSS
jgi:hypothetical protein